ncbi:MULTISPECIES: hypothetical protein [Providencia]|uniref:hypothetical protein n=1 Tax=Providencia TaxID=586 RepID=UPI0008FB07CB|nr:MULTISPECIES: hypothetical protein [Providencia]APC10554.1 hypothetical protein RB151_008490 [Providencia rettgeri]AVL74170.1 hypothetical protein CEQ08_10690 [Providencia rettgeri]EKH6499085.1 hypothetical protein [Providencia rettgeri]ELR5055243.1 hypothetical protein [Providencia rettgeri]ELR5157799.1 hypothetical protein [Providencia rettgeri]
MSSYCQKALDDLAGKHQGAADVAVSLVNGDSWNAIQDLAKRAGEGDQLAAEQLGSMMAGVFIPGKKVPAPVTGGKITGKLPEGSNWAAGEGAFSPNNGKGTVTDVVKGDAKYDGHSLPYGKDGLDKGTTGKQTVISETKQLNVSKDKFATPENPGITQSRVNVENVTYDNGKTRGFDYAMGKHDIDASVPNKSRFTVTNNEVKELLQRPDVVNKPVYNPIQIGGKVETDKFVRQVDIGKSIGVDQRGKSTSVITIITDRKGNLINTFPGAL